MTNKPIILIGGASGTGKSTLANRLLCRLNLDHKVGVGFVRAVVQAETTPEKDPELFSMTFQAEDPIAHLTTQTKRLLPAIMACINRARREGTSLVMESPHLLPEFFHDAPVDAYIVLAAPAPAQHIERIKGPTHTKRQVTERDIKNIQSINQHYLEQCQLFGIEPIESGDNLDAIIRCLDLS